MWPSSKKVTGTALFAVCVWAVRLGGSVCAWVWVWVSLGACLCVWVHVRVIGCSWDLREAGGRVERLVDLGECLLDLLPDCSKRWTTIHTTIANAATAHTRTRPWLTMPLRRQPQHTNTRTHTRRKPFGVDDVINVSSTCSHRRTATRPPQPRWLHAVPSNGG